MEVRFLGPFDVVQEGRSISIGGGRQRALLAILALHPREVVPVSRLIDELWPEDPPESALNTLQAYVSRLRKVLRGELVDGNNGVIVFDHGGYRLDLSVDDVDSYRFERLVEDADRCVQSGDAESATRVLTAALELWRGPALPEFADEPFAQTEIARLNELRLRAVEARIGADLARGRDAALIAELEALVAEHPHREGFRTQLMLALYRSGRQGDALSVYRDTRRVLDADLGVEPTPALQDLQLAILRHDPSLAAPPRARALPSRVGRRGRVWIGGIAAALVGVAVLIGAVLRTSGDPAVVEVVPHSVAVVDARTNAIVDDVIVGDYPGPIAERNGSVWVGNIGASTVTEIDAATRKPEFPSSAQRPVDLAVTDDALWIANASDFETQPPTGGGTISRRELRAGKLEVIQVGPPRVPDENRTFVATDGASVWAGNSTGRTVVRLDRKTGRILLRTSGVAGSGIALGFGAVWIPEPERDTVARLDPVTGRIEARIPVSGRPTEVAVGERAVWVTTTGGHSGVWRIDPRTNETIAVIPVPPKARRVATGGGFVWVTSGRSDEEGVRRRGTLTKIDPSTHEIVASIPLPFRPDGVVFAHDLVWVAVAPI